MPDDRPEEREQALQAAAGEAKFRALLESAPDAIIAIDGNGRIVLVNSQTETLFGYGRAELLGRTVECLVPDRFRERHVRDRVGFCQEPRLRPMGLGLDLVARRKDGTEFPTEISLSPLRTDEGLLVMAVIRDMTERRKLEEQRLRLLQEQAARAEAEAASRAKDNFLAVVSHELRTPLNAMLGWTVLLRSNPGDGETAPRALAAIERNARAQLRLIEDLLDVSRMVAGKMRIEVQQVHLAPIVEAALDAVRPAAEAKGVHLEAALDGRAPTVAGDAGRLQQVAWNLLSNAVKFTPAGGRVTVRLQPTNLDVQIVVEDTGQGIPADVLPHVFERFRQAESGATRSSGGLGLGLAIVRQLVELHGGSVEALSDGPGRGATFVIRLPRPAALADRA